MLYPSWGHIFVHFKRKSMRNTEWKIECIPPWNTCLECLLPFVSSLELHLRHEFCKTKIHQLNKNPSVFEQRNTVIVVSLGTFLKARACMHHRCFYSIKLLFTLFMYSYFLIYTLIFILCYLYLFFTAESHNKLM